MADNIKLPPGATLVDQGPTENRPTAAAAASSVRLPPGATLLDSATAPATTSERVYQNDAGQPFTMSGRPPAPAATDQGYTGTILPLSRDSSGLHLAVPEAIASPVRGMEEGGKRALGVGEGGQDPLRPLSSDELAAIAATGQLPFRAGAAVPAAAGPAASGISRERALLAKEATDTFGIPVTASQVGMSKTAQLAESAVKSLPMSGAREFEGSQRQAFNRAVSKTFGEDAPAITQSVMNTAKKRIGGEINRVENSAEVKLDDSFLQKLGEIETATQSSVTPAEFSVIEKQLAGVLHNVQPDGSIQGLTYGKLLGRDSPLDQATRNSNSNISRPAQQIKDALQDALQRSLSGDDLAAYQKARFQYKNMKTVEPLVNKAPEGNISPALLNSRVTQQFPNRAYDTGGSNQLDTLAKIGQAFLKEQPTSGTAERGWTLARLGELGAAVAAGDILGVPAALGGAAATLGAGRLISSMMRSPRLAARSIRKTLDSDPPRTPAPPGSTLSRAIPGAFLGGQPTLPQSDTDPYAAQFGAQP
jgi:hypothetical protein